ASFLKTTTPNLFSEKTKKNSPDLIENMIDSSKYFSAEVLVQYYKTMMKRPDRTHVLQTFKKPVIFIIGKNDNSVPLQASMEQCHLPAIAFIKLLPESGHMGLWEERKAANAFLMESMKQL
ncbi:MAG TPA: hypothetical protein VLM16_06990, partial [Ginsengibacter sp.]|nr:hypothetical protein [Ginsengibacter sp.]